MPGTTPTFGFRYQLGADPPDGDDLGKNLAEDVEARILLERNVPMCQLVQQTAQTGWTTGAMTPITFGASSEVVDTDNLHNVSSNTSRIVIGSRLGWWLVSGVFAPAINGATTGARAAIHKNGTVINGAWVGQGANTGSIITGVSVAGFLVQATVSTDYVELHGWHQAPSGTLGTTVNTYATSSFNAVWIRPS